MGEIHAKELQAPNVILYSLYIFHYVFLLAIIFSGSPLAHSVPILIAQTVAFLLWAWTLRSMQHSKLSIFHSVPKNHRLIPFGAYKYVRHPLNFLELMAAILLTMDDMSLQRGALLVIFIAILHIKVLYAEKLLGDRWSSYSQYKSHVDRLIPFVY